MYRNFVSLGCPRVITSHWNLSRFSTSTTLQFSLNYILKSFSSPLRLHYTNRSPIFWEKSTATPNAINIFKFISPISSYPFYLTPPPPNLSSHYRPIRTCGGLNKSFLYNIYMKLGRANILTHV